MAEAGYLFHHLRGAMSTFKSQKGEIVVVIFAPLQSFLNNERSQAFTPIFFSYDQQTGINRGVYLLAIFHFLRKVSHEAHDLFALVGGKEVVFIFYPVSEIMEEGRPVEIREGGFAVFFPPGKEGHPFQGFQIPAKGFNGDAAELSHLRGDPFLEINLSYPSFEIILSLTVTLPLK